MQTSAARYGPDRRAALLPHIAPRGASWPINIDLMTASSPPRVATEGKKTLAWFKRELIRTRTEEGCTHAKARGTSSASYGPRSHKPDASAPRLGSLDNPPAATRNRRACERAARPAPVTGA